MNKTIYRWKILISDFFNKVPTAILIPGILLGSFVIAVFLIWTGMKLAPVGVKESLDPYQSNGNTNKSVKIGNNSNTNGGNYGDQFDPSAESSYNPPGAQARGGSGNENSNSDSQSGGAGNSSGNNDSANPANITQSSSSSSSASTSGSNSENVVDSASSSSSTASQGRGESSNNCSYPEGSINLWWKHATKKQRDCYISQNGQPNFDKNTPYFCDYENNDDCYNK